MNPYTQRILGYLGDRPCLASLEETAGRIQATAAQLVPDRLERSRGAGTWTAREILCHLADVELAAGFRLRQALSEDDHRIQPFDQDRWASRYGALDAAIAVRSLAALREWNLALIRTLGPEDLARPAFHPERGPEPVDAIIKMLAGHDLNHLAQLETIARG
jgi:hypothetical protein